MSKRRSNELTTYYHRRLALETVRAAYLQAKQRAIVARMELLRKGKAA